MKKPPPEVRIDGRRFPVLERIHVGGRTFMVIERLGHIAARMPTLKNVRVCIDHHVAMPPQDTGRSTALPFPLLLVTPLPITHPADNTTPRLAPTPPG